MLIGIVVLALAIGAVVLVAGRRVAGEALEAVLRDQGVPVDSLDLARVGWGSARLDHVVLANGAVRIDMVHAFFDLRRLIADGRLESVTLQGVAVTGPLPALAMPGEAAGPAALPDLPIGRLRVTDATAMMETMAGPLTVQVGGLDAVPVAAGLQFRGAAEIAGDRGQARLSFAGLVGRDFRVDMAAALEAGEARAAGFEAAALTGLAAATAGPDGLRTLAGLVSTAEPVETPGPGLEGIAFWGAGGPDGIDHLSMRAGVPALSGRAAVEARRAGEDGAERLAVSAMAEAGRLDSLASVLGLAATGRGRVEAALTVPLPDLRALAATGHWPEDAEAEGSVAVRLRRLALPGVMEDGSLSVSGRLQAGRDALHLRGDRPWLLAGLWQGVQARGVLTLGSDGRPAQAALARAEDGLAAELAGPVAVRSRLGGIFGDGRLAATLAEDGTLAGLSWQGDLAALPIRLGAAWLVTDEVRVDGQWQDGVTDSRLSAQLGLDGTIARDVAVRDGQVRLDGTLRVAGGQAVFRPDACVDIAVRSVRIGDGVAMPDGIALCLDGPEDGTLLAVTLSGDGAGAISAEAGAADISVPLTVGATAAELSAERLAIEGEVDAGGGDHDVRVGLAGATLTVPEAALRAEDLGVATRFRAGEPPLAIDLAEGQLRSLADPAWIAPLALTASGEVDRRGRLSFRADGTGVGGALRLIARGEVLETGSGHVALSLAPVSVAPGVRSVRTLFPILAATPVREAAGSLSAELSYGWGAEAHDWARVALSDLDLFIDSVAVLDVEGRMVVASFDPLVLWDGQELAIGRVGLGLPLRDGRVVFGFRGPDRLSVSDLRFALAGGSLSAEPFTLGLDRDGERRIAVRAADLDVATLVGLAEIANLQATGRLSGRIPLRLLNDMIRIDDAVLESQGPGVIRYTGAGLAGFAGAGEVEGTPGPPGQGGVELLAEAVRNFQYESLRLSLSGAIGGEMTGEVRIRGANPELYGGYPIALTVNLSGALSEVLRRSLETGRLAERLEEHYRRRAGQSVSDDILETLEAIQE
jgi:hypothetical protein